MKIILFFSFLSVSIAGIAQNTWSDNVAQIVYDKCSQCHHTGGVGPFPLMTYAQTSPMASAIQAAISSNAMPPWPPNNNFQQYSHDRSLSTAEKSALLDWIATGTPEGVAANTPPPPVYSGGVLLGAGDLEVQIPTYMSKALANGDDYACFAMPSGLTQDRVIRAVEIIPGNR